MDKAQKYLAHKLVVEMRFNGERIIQHKLDIPTFVEPRAINSLNEQIRNLIEKWYNETSN